jgi:predicted acylesterase/phospholipase RssA
MCTATSRAGNGIDLVEAAKRAPRGAAATRLPPCDLVMKGGITSGVVYPGAAIALANSFRFAAVGGTSAGAIAAGVCAAGEYGRLRDAGGGLEELGAVSEELSKDGFLPALFQATPGARPLMDLALLAARHSDDSLPRRAARLAVGAIGRAPAVGALAVAALLGLALLTWGAFRGFPTLLAATLAVLVAAPLAAFLLAVMAAMAGGLLVARTIRSLPASTYGICPGTRQPGYADGQPALTEWLHARVQAAAGRRRSVRNAVLTVDDLQTCGIELETMTTDLSRGRPLRCPPDLAGYRFRPREMRELFPAEVVARMVQPDPADPEPAAEELRSDELREIDPKRLPVLVAIRLSLSFPGLLSAVPLYRRQEYGGEFRGSLFSDGGIASNFPVHFFDAWFPRRPTFGIDLNGHPGGDAPWVVMHGENGVGPYRRIDGPTAFCGQIKDTMQNWAQALPMTTPPDPPTQRWIGHCLTRFELLMALEQRGLQVVSERSADFLAALARGSVTPPERASWATAAAEQTKRLLDCVSQWGPAPKLVDFELPPPPPEPVMRVVPKA